MDRISGANYITLLGKRMFQSRNQTTGTPGTFFTPVWANGVQESILAPVEAVGLVATDADNTQLLQAIQTIATHDFYAFTAVGPFTWNVPPGWTNGHAIMIGAGAGGARGNGYAGWGGSSGGFAWINFGVPAGSALFTGYVGAGGASDTAGGTTSFAMMSATGGNPGAMGSPAGFMSTGAGLPGSVTTASSALTVLGQLQLPGAYGSAGVQAGSALIGGSGANSFFGGSGLGGLQGGTSGAGATAPGAGGGGGTGDNPGGPGGSGLVVIWR